MSDFPSARDFPSVFPSEQPVTGTSNLTAPRPETVEVPVEPLPCPFCAAPGKVLKGSPDGYFVTCSRGGWECGICELTTYRSKTREAAVKTWNRRPIAAAPAEELAKAMERIASPEYLVWDSDELSSVNVRKDWRARVKLASEALAAFRNKTSTNLCVVCGSEGRLYSGHPNDPHPRDAGECPACKGSGFAPWTADAAAPDAEVEELLETLEHLSSSKQRSAWDCASCGVETNTVDAVIRLVTTLRAQLAEAEAKLSHYADQNFERTIARLWDVLGNPTYEPGGPDIVERVAAQAKRIAELEAAYEGVKASLHTAEKRTQSAETVVSKIEDILTEFGEDGPTIIGEYLTERNHELRIALLSATEKGSG